MARPVRESVVGDVEARRLVVEAVSAASSSARRESWMVTNSEMSTAVGAIVKGKHSYATPFEIRV